MKITYAALILFLIVVGSVSANSVFVVPSDENVSLGDTFSIVMYANTTTSDLYGMQLDISYDERVFNPVNVVEGTFLDENASVATIFDYSLSTNSIDDLVMLRNVTNASGDSVGVSGEGILCTVTFELIDEVNATIVFENIIWVNSTITNTSTNAISIDDMNVSFVFYDTGGGDDGGDTGTGSDGGGGSGGGGGSSGSDTTQTTTNETTSQEETAGNEEQNSDSGEQEDPNETGGLIPFTGKAVDETFGENSFVSSLAFYFLIAIVIGAVGFLVYRIHKMRKKNKKVNKSWYPVSFY